MNDWIVLAVVTVPFTLLVAAMVFDAARRRDLSTLRRLAWVVFLLAVPVVGLATYLAVRPPRGAGTADRRSDTGRAEALVVLAERRQRGELTDDVYVTEVRPLLVPPTS